MLALLAGGWFLGEAWKYRYIDPINSDLSKLSNRQLLHVLLELTLLYDTKIKGRFHSTPDLVKSDPEFNNLCKRINIVVDEMRRRKIDNPLSNSLQRLPTV